MENNFFLSSLGCADLGLGAAFVICSLPSRKGPDPQEKAGDGPARVGPSAELG